MRKQDSIAVVYLCDVNYHRLTLYSISSLLSTQAISCDIMFFQFNYSSPLPEKVIELARSRGSNVRVIENVVPKFDFSYMNRDTHAHISRTANLKIQSIDEAVKSYDRVVYADSDILFYDDLQIARYMPQSTAIAAVTDFDIGTGMTHGSVAGRAGSFGLPPRYFNSGLMFINSRRWLEDELSRKFVAAHRDHEGNCPYLQNCKHNDQCSFNIACGGAWSELPSSYNVQKSAFQTALWKNAKARHYTGRNKFIPIRPIACDRQERQLLDRFRRIVGDESRFPVNDFGVAYLANRLRRRASIRDAERHLAAAGIALSPNSLPRSIQGVGSRAS